MSNNVRYVFYYPAYTIGGAQLLFARIAEALIKKGHSVLIVEHDRSFIHGYLNEQRLKFEVVRVSEASRFSATADDLLILSLSYVFLFRQFIDAAPETRFIFWDLHPFALVETTVLSIIHKLFPNSCLSLLACFFEKRFLTKINLFITEAGKQNSLYFLCLRNFLTNKDLFKLDLEPTYLPIPIPINNNTNTDAKVDGNPDAPLKPEVINIGWISRMDSDKLKILKLLLEDVIQFNILSDHIKVLIHLIGDENKARHFFGGKYVNGDFLRLPGELFGNDLNDYIAKNIDLGFSMGTASLEFASRRIPTALVPSTTCYGLFRKVKRRYLWLFDSYGYDVAVEDFHLEKNAQKFETIIDSFLNEGNNLAKKSYAYVVQNHSFNNVFMKFKSLTDGSTITMRDLNRIGLYNHSSLQTLFFGLKRVFKELLRH